MKKSRLFILLMAVCAIIGLSYGLFFNLKPERDNENFTAEGNIEKLSVGQAEAIPFTRWNVDAAVSQAGRRIKKPYTIMVYMNGSDLESENGAATEDIIEMLKSGVHSVNANIIIFTGGTNRWQNDVIPENECVLWEIADGKIYRIAGVGLVNMGNSGTLSSFIEFSLNSFPAEKYGLIMWDHGGGAIAGYGHDEKFNNSNLTLPDMEYAFSKAGLSQTKLEFLGFDSCLMATVEMGLTASEYAKYLIASEDVEPGAGWDYTFLKMLNSNPNAGGHQIGREIIDYFMEYYGTNTDEILTLSVTDLSRVKNVMESMGDLMSKCSESLIADRVPTFRTLAKRRGGTKTFGDGSPIDSRCDMVDIGDMAAKLYDLFPTESAAVMQELAEAVIYNRHNSNVDLKGLSAYYIYSGKSDGRWSVGAYTDLNVNESYTEYLYDFYYSLRRGNGLRSSAWDGKLESELTPDDILESSLTLWQACDDGTGRYMMKGIREMPAEDATILWPTINGKNVCLYKINVSGERSLYSIPAMVNGSDCDILVLISDRHPNGKILGLRREDGLIIQKGYDKLNDGDTVSFYYQTHSLEDGKLNESGERISGDEFTINGSLSLIWLPPPTQNPLYATLTTDILHNQHIKFFVGGAGDAVK